jgi:hypothetical protein
VAKQTRSTKKTWYYRPETLVQKVGPDVLSLIELFGREVATDWYRRSYLPQRRRERELERLMQRQAARRGAPAPVDEDAELELIPF